MANIVKIRDKCKKCSSFEVNLRETDFEVVVGIVESETISQFEFLVRLDVGLDFTEDLLGVGVVVKAPIVVPLMTT